MPGGPGRGYVQPGNDTGCLSARQAPTRARLNLVNMSGAANGHGRDCSNSERLARMLIKTVNQASKELHVDPAIPVYSNAITLLTQPIDNIQDLISRGPVYALKQGGQKLCLDVGDVAILPLQHWTKCARSADGATQPTPCPR